MVEDIYLPLTPGLHTHVTCSPVCTCAQNNMNAYIHHRKRGRNFQLSSTLCMFQFKERGFCCCCHRHGDAFGHKLGLSEAQFLRYKIKDFDLMTANLFSTSEIL